MLTGGLAQPIGGGGTTGSYAGPGSVAPGANLTATERAWYIAMRDTLRASLPNNPETYLTAIPRDPTKSGYAVFMTQGGEEGKVLLADGYGTRNPYEGTPFTINTVAGIRSITKSITGILAAKYGSVNGTGGSVAARIDNFMDQPLNTWALFNDNLIGRSTPLHGSDAYMDRTGPVSGFPTPGCDTGLADVTLRMVITHTSKGFQRQATHVDWDPNMVSTMVYARSCGDGPGIVQNYDRFSSFQSAPWPGTSATAYDDKNHWLTAPLLEVLTGQSWPDLVDAQMTALGISNIYPTLGGVATHGDPSAVNLTAEADGHWARPMSYVGGNLALLPALQFSAETADAYQEVYFSSEYGGAIGSAYASVRSLAKWVREVHLPSTYLTAAEIAEIFSPQTGLASVGGAGSWPGRNWGYGPQLMASVNGREIWGSIGSGGFGGVGAAEVYCPSLDITVACISNGLLSYFPSGVFPLQPFGPNVAYSLLRAWIETFDV